MKSVRSLTKIEIDMKNSVAYIKIKFAPQSKTFIIAA